MGDVNCSVTGLDELERMLNDLAPKAAKTAMRRAVRDGMEIFQAAAEGKAPRASGELADNINIKTTAGGGDGDTTTGSIEAIVGPGKQQYYGLFQEYGTRYQPAQPFMTPAYEENKDKVLETFVSDLKDEIEGLAGK
jgi:HK97 gp10 family phage protein